jgi:hypothetical protein
MKLGREARERSYEEALAKYNSGKATATEALIRAGLASREVKLAYRFPRLFGHLAPLAAADRLRPMYAPAGGWRTAGIQPGTYLSDEPATRPARAEEPAGSATDR